MTRNIVTIISQKLVKGVSRNFGHNLFGLIDVLIRFRVKVKGQGSSRLPEKLDEYNSFVNMWANFFKIRSRMYLGLGHTD